MSRKTEEHSGTDYMHVNSNNTSSTLQLSHGRGKTNVYIISFDKQS